jgi:ribose/xylose/arabinose/galactoside ABC-type transport system permease subunit
MSEVKNNTTAPKVDTRKTEINKFSLIFNRLGIWIIVAALIILGLIISKGQFFSKSNIQSILEAVALTGMVCAGLFYVTYSGNMTDMSVPITMAFGGVMAVQCINFGFVGALIVGLLAGALIGVINGFMVGKMRANAIIWTLAVNLLISGVIRVVWQGKMLYAEDIASEDKKASAELFYSISRTYIGGVISLMAIVMLAMFIVSWFIHTKTAFGQKLKIIGTNYEVAKFSGIDCTKQIIIAYIINGLCGATAGIFYAALRKCASYENGTGYDFDALTAILLGGVSLDGGKGTMVGTFGGVLAYGILNNILSWVGLGTYSKYLVQGIVFLFIVGLNTYSNRKLGKA